MTPQMFCSFVEHPQDIRFDGEDKDEKVLYVLRKSFVTNLEWILLSLAFLLTPTLLSIFLAVANAQIPDFIPSSLLIVLTLFWYLFSVMFIFERFLNWFFNIYMITTKRIVDMDFNNFLNRTTSDAPLRNIEDITYNNKGVFEIFFNYGDLQIQTAAENTQFEFVDVPNPAKIQDILSDLVKEIKAK